MLIALSRAYVWNRWLDEGKFENAKELASAVGIEASMVRRILRLGTLNPRFVEGVIGGAEPRLSLDRLMNGDVAAVWGEEEVGMGER